MKKQLLLIPALFLLINSKIYAQNNQHPNRSQARGVSYVNPDSAFSVNFRFRMQNRAMYSSVSGSDFSAEEFEARVRRLRLRLEGFMYDPKLTYFIQLSFSRGDMDWNVKHLSAVNESPNVVRDAVIFYRPNQQWQFIFGQTKLPGNRQRVVSSGELQFIDRSIVNATFNIDRDFGFQVYYYNNINNLHYIIKTALTTGDGRNVTMTNSGLSYTGRLELLPLGWFTNMGDYFEGDLAREETPKISIAGGINYNADARRTGGQIGRDLLELRSMRTYIFDGLLKYRGYALYLEYIQREANDPVTFNGSDTRHIITGSGALLQTSYLFKNNFEIAARYSNVRPGNGISHLEPSEDILTGGVTKYLRAHRLKLQANLSYHDLKAFGLIPARNYWYGGVQIELGI